MDPTPIDRGPPVPPRTEGFEGRYAVGERLGAGGMAEVFRAVDLVLRRPVAIKFLHRAASGDPTSRERFLREARTVAKLHHPNLVRVHDAGESEGRLWLAMELVEGGDLARLLGQRGGGRGVRKLVALLEKAARGVAHAHTAGVVHRDLKPSNVLVAADGEPKVADFGLSRGAGDETGLTRSGAILGTPLYMAPEQVESRHGQVGPRTDVYALGAILYQVLSGRTPHRADSAPALFHKIVGEDPEPPRRFARSVPPDLEKVALAALARNPARRYADAGEFADDLARFLSGTPVVAAPPAFRWRGARPRIGRSAWALAATLGGGLALGFALLERGGEAVPVPPVESPPTEDPEAREAEARAREVREVLALLEPVRAALERERAYLYRAGAARTELLHLLEGARAGMGEAIRRAPRLAAPHVLDGSALRLAGDRTHAERAWRRALEVEPGFAPAEYLLARLLLEKAFLANLTLEDSARKRSGVFSGSTEAEEARALIESALSQPGAFDGEVDRDLAEAMLAFARGDVLAVQRLAADRAERYAGREGAEDFFWLLAALCEDRSESLRSLDRAIAIAPHHPLARFVRGVKRREAGDRPGAIEDFTVALEFEPSLAMAAYDRGIARRELGDIEGAIADWTLVLELEPAFERAWYSRGVARTELGDLEAARADLDRAVELEPDRAPNRLARGVLLYRLGDLAGARTDLDRAVEIDPGNPEVWSNRAVVRGVSDDLAGAISDCDRAIALEGSYADAHANRAIARWKLGDLEGAASDLARAIELSEPSSRARQRYTRTLETVREEMGR